MKDDLNTLNKLIIQMEQRHVEEVCKISEECFSEPWSLDGIRTELENKNSITFVCEIDGKTIGFVNMHFILDEGCINNIAVTSIARNMEIGSDLINHLIEFGRKKSLSFITLEVRESNAKAINFYEKHEFLKVGMRKNFYNKPIENALLYTFYYNK